MAAPTYLDFDLFIEGAQGDYRARVSSPAGEAKSSLRLLASELEDTLLRSGRLLGSARPGGSEQRGRSERFYVAREFGRRLFEAVFTDAVLKHFHHSQALADAEGKALRIRLNLTDVPELAVFPWELLYDPSDKRFLAISDRTLLVRYLSSPGPARPPLTAPKLRVLALISSPSGQPVLNTEQEWSILREALSDLVERGLVELERVEGATPTALLRQLKQGEHHVLHFIGQISTDPQRQDSWLLLEDEKRESSLMSGRQLAMLLHDDRTLRLVVLDTDEQTSRLGINSSAGLAQRLVGEAVSAVLTLQAEKYQAKVVFTREFYRALADNTPVEAAVAKVRQAIYNQINDPAWGRPALYTCVHDGQLFHIEAPTPGLHDEAGAEKSAQEAAPVTQAEEIKKLITALFSRSHNERLDAIRKLGETGDERAVDPLLSVLKSATERKNLPAKERHEAAKVRETVAQSLGRLRVPRTTSQLVKLLSDKSPPVRRAAAESLGRVKDRSTINGLFKMLRDVEPENRLAGARVIASMFGPTEAGLLLELLGSRDADVLDATVKALDKTRDPGNAAIWRRLIQSDKEPVRRAATDALVQANDPQASELLIRLLQKDKRSDVRRLAAETLGRIGAVDAIDDLKKALESSDEALAQTARTALAQLGFTETETASQTDESSTQTEEAPASSVSAMQNAYALIVGIADYVNRQLKLRTTAREGQQLYDLLVDPGHGGYSQNNVLLLLDRLATGAAIRQALATLVKRATGDATLLIYFTGHGGQTTSQTGGGQELFLLPVDYSEESGIPASVITGTELTAFLRQASSPKTLVVLDCSHSGLLEAGPTWAVLSSAGGNEMAYESEDQSFTRRFIEALAGEAAGPDGLIRIFELFEYIQPRVTGDFPQQHPVLKADPTNNFPIALLPSRVRPEAVVEEEGFRYDVYISFAEMVEESAWVRGSLIPHLKEAGLRVAISNSVEKDEGVRRVANAERGITQSKRTLIVLSQQYLEHEMKEFEGAFHRTIGLGGRRRLLAVNFVPDVSSKLPDWLQQRTIQWQAWMSMSEPSFQRLVEELKRPLPDTELVDFSAREWALRRINGWLEEPEPRVCLLTGAPGSGKSTLVQWLVAIAEGRVTPPPNSRLGPNSVAAISMAEVAHNPWRFIEGIAKQLADHYSEFAVALQGVVRSDERLRVKTGSHIIEDSTPDDPHSALQSLDLSVLPLETAFELAVSRPLLQLYYGGIFHETIIIVVDALDEAVGHGTNEEIVTVLNEEIVTVLHEAGRLPPQVRFLLTSRPAPFVLDSFPDALLLNLDNAIALKELMSHLSPEAQEAFLWAEGFRQAKEVPELHSEYLLAALYQKPDGPTRNLLTLFDDEPAISSQLSRFVNALSLREARLEEVRPAPREALGSLPLSDGLERALGQASALAEEKEWPYIKERLLLGALVAEPTNMAGGWVAEALQIPRATLSSLINEAEDALLPLGRIWRESTRRPLFLPLRGHESPVTAVAFSPDGQRLFSGDADGKVCVWDTESLTLIKTWEEHQAPSTVSHSEIAVQKILVSPKNEVLVGWQDGRIESFDLNLDKKFGEVRTSGNLGLKTFALTPDNERLVTAHPDGTLFIRELHSGAEKRTHGHTAGVTDIALTPDGRRIVSVSLDQTLRVWDLETGELLLMTGRAQGGQFAVVVMPDGKRAVSGSLHGTLTMWNIEGGEELFTLRGHSSEVAAMALIDDGRQLLTASRGGTLRAWNLETGEGVPISGRKLEFNALAVAADGRTIATGTTDNLVRLWDRATLIPAPRVAPAAARRYQVALTSSPTEVVVGQRVRVQVNLVPAASNSGGFELPPGVAALSCFISAEDNGLRIQSTEAADIHLEEETGEFMPVTFELQAYLRGERAYSIQLFAEDSASGRLRIYESSGKLRVTPPQAGTDRPPMLSSVDVRVAPQPDFVLHVETEFPEGEAGPRELVYRLSSRLPDLRLRHEEVGRVVLQAGEVGRLRALLLSTLRPLSGALQPEDARARLLSFGTYLFDRLFPAEQAASFRDAYWKAADQLTTWLFAEDGVTWLPWELLVPYREADDETPLRFLGERFLLSRWVELGPALYSEVPLGEIALAHYKAQAPGEEDEEIASWQTLLKAPGTSGITEVVKQETPFYRLHLLRYAEALEGREIVARDQENATASPTEDARRARLDLRLKRPIISLSILDGGGAQAELAQDWPLPDRATPFLRAGASAVVGPWWPTSATADRIFWLNFYDLLERRVPLGEAVWRSRLAVESALPERADWLAYTLFGDPRARAYEPEPSEGYTTLERLYSDEPVRPGLACYFRASISRRPSFIYQDRLVQTDELPKDPMALFLAPGLQENVPEPVEMKPVGRSTVEAIYKLTPQQTGKFVLIARLYDGEERLQSLRLPLIVE